MSHRRHEAPRRVVRPLDARLFTGARYDRLNETRLTDLDCDREAGFLEEPLVIRVRGSHALRRIVEEVEISTVAGAGESEVERRSSGQVAVRGACGREERENLLLVGRQGHSERPIVQASRSPCFMSCSATHVTSSLPISRSGR